MEGQKSPDAQVDAVLNFDGQRLSTLSGITYELGSYLGGGSSGVVYEATNCETNEHVAVKIASPLGYRLLPAAAVARCTVLLKVSQV